MGGGFRMKKYLLFAFIAPITIILGMLLFSDNHKRSISSETPTFIE